MENEHDTAGTPAAQVALQAVGEVVLRLEEAVEVLTGREAGDGTRTFALDLVADESIEHVQRAFELLTECTGEVGRALWFLRKQATEGASAHGA